MQLQDARYLTLLLKEEDSAFCCKHTVFGTGSQVSNRESYGPEVCSGRTLSDDWSRSTRAYSLESRQKPEININTTGWGRITSPHWGYLRQAPNSTFPTITLPDSFYIVPHFQSPQPIPTTDTNWTFWRFCVWCYPSAEWGQITGHTSNKGTPSPHNLV